MRTKFFSLFFCCLLASLLVSTADAVVAEKSTADDVTNLIEGILECEVSQANATSVQEWIDGELADNAGLTSEWYVLALSRMDEGYNFSLYGEKLLKFLETSSAGVVSKQKYALAMIAADSEDEEYISSVMSDSIGKQGIMSFVFGLHLINNGYICKDYKADLVIDELLDLRLDDGGWALVGKISDIDVTAMVIQSIAPYYSSHDNVKTAIDDSLHFLSQKQLDNGGFSSFGKENPESSAQVIIALSSLGIDCFSDMRFIKNGNTILDGIKEYLLPNGAFCHEIDGGYNLSATVQVFCALTSLKDFHNGQGFYIIKSSQPESYEAEVTSLSQGSSETQGKSLETEREALDEKSDVPAYKIYLPLIIIAVSVLACIFLQGRGKKGAKSCFTVIIIALISIVFILLTDFKSVDDYYNTGISQKDNVIGNVTFSIRCDVVADKSDLEYIPKDGVILDKTKFDISEMDSVYSILLEATRAYKIHLDTKGAGMSSDKMVYVRGINYLYEFDFGDLSGWIYRVNKETASVDCSAYILSDGDEIEWIYTLELGNDIK